MRIRRGPRAAKRIAPSPAPAPIDPPGARRRRRDEWRSRNVGGSGPGGTCRASATPGRCAVVIRTAARALVAAPGAEQRQRRAAVVALASRRRAGAARDDADTRNRMRADRPRTTGPQGRRSVRAPASDGRHGARRRADRRVRTLPRARAAMPATDVAAQAPGASRSLSVTRTATDDPAPAPEQSRSGQAPAAGVATAANAGDTRLGPALRAMVDARVRRALSPGAALRRGVRRGRPSPAPQARTGRIVRRPVGPPGSDPDGGSQRHRSTVPEPPQPTTQRTSVVRGSRPQRGPCAARRQRSTTRARRESAGETAASPAGRRRPSTPAANGVGCARRAARQREAPGRAQPHSGAGRLSSFSRSPLSANSP